MEAHMFKRLAQGCYLVVSESRTSNLAVVSSKVINIWNMLLVCGQMQI